MSVALATLFVLVLVLMGCGSSGGGATESPAATSTAAAESPAAESPDAGWATVATLRSTDPANDLGLLVSDEFTVAGDVQVVLDMPEGEDVEGVIAAFLPAGEPITVEAGAAAESVALAVAMPSQVVSGLDGAYVVLATPSTTREWSLEIQTKP
jgi:hypothetical protein